MRIARSALAPLLPLGAVLILLLALSACASVSTISSPSPTPVPGGTYVIPLESDPGIEPLSVDDSASVLVNHQVFQGLVRWETGTDGIVRGAPGLAERWSVNHDATVWTFRLRKGVTFQPPVSREVTAKDFVDDWNYVTDPANGSLVAYMLSSIKGTDSEGYRRGGRLSGVKALGRYTLRITLKYPFADFPLVLGAPVAGVWPRDYMKKVSPESFRNKPIGTGPYMVDRWAHGKYVDLVKNPDYWDTSAAGYVDGIHMPIMDVETQWQEFQKGTIDFSSVPPDEIAAAKTSLQVRDGSWTAKAWPQLVVILVGIDQKSHLVGGSANLALRQALSYAVDRATVMTAANDAGVSPTASVPATGLVPSGMLQRDAGGLVYPFDLARAKEIVGQIPSPPTLSYLSWGAVPTSTRGLSPLDTPLLAGWKSAGLDVTRKGYEWNTYIRKVASGTQGDLFVTGWMADYPSPDAFLFPTFHSGSSGAATLSTFYRSPRIDHLLEEARGTLDESRRLDLYAQAERQILTDAPVIPLYFFRDFRVASTRVQGQALDPMGTMDMWKVWVK